MSFTVTGDSLLLTATTPLAYTADIYYVKRLKVDSVTRKIYIDSSPSCKGSFVQDFDDMLWNISGGSLLIRQTSEALCKSVFQTYAALIKHQVGLTLSIPNESGSFPNCVCSGFELFRFSNGEIVRPDGNGSTFRAYVMMDFVQLSRT